MFEVFYKGKKEAEFFVVNEPFFDKLEEVLYILYELSYCSDRAQLHKDLQKKEATFLYVAEEVRVTWDFDSGKVWVN